MASMTFTPVVEPPDSAEEAFLSQSPSDILRSESYGKVPMLIGSTNKEGSIFFLNRKADEYLPKMNEDYNTLLPDAVYDALGPGKREEVALKVKRFYFCDQDINQDTLPNVVDVIGDGMLLHGVHVASRWHAKQATAEAPVFLYHFSKDSYGAGFSALMGAPRLNGSGHVDDLTYVFKHNILGDKPLSNPEYLKGKAQMTEIISNFVKTLNPVPSKTETLNIVWPMATYPGEKYLDIGEELLVKQDLLHDRMDLWDEVFASSLGDPIFKY